MQSYAASAEDFNCANGTAQFNVNVNDDDDEPHIYLEDHEEVAYENTPFDYNQAPSNAVLSDHEKMINFEESMLLGLARIP